MARTARSGSEIIRNGLGRAAPTTLAKLVGWVGIGLAVAEIWEGYKNRDLAESSAGALSLVGAVIFFAGVAVAWPVAILGALCIVAGVVISFFKDTDYEKWAKRGFWGSSPKFNDRLRNENFSSKLEQLVEYKKDGVFDDYFNKELKYLLHMIYKPRITDNLLGDGKLEIFFYPFSKGRSETLEINIYANSGSINGRSRRSGSISFVTKYLSDGVIEVYLENLDEYRRKWVSVSLSMDRYPNGEFKTYDKFPAGSI